MRIHDRKASIQETVNDSLTRARNAQEKLNAVVTFVDCDEQIKAVEGLSDGALHGVCVALKDNISTKGIRTTASSRILDNYVPVFDAHVVEKLKAAGAIIVAKTSLDELGMGGTNLNAYTGKVNNPYDFERISGGSSGGSAAIVAGGIVPIALGSDTGDSVRKPAAYCGIVGFKPTYGRISRYGVIPYASSLDHVGFFTTNISDACVTLEVLAGRDERDVTSSQLPVEKYVENLNSDVEGKRIAVLDNVLSSIKDEAILKNFAELCEKLEKRGAIIEHVRMSDELLNTLLPVYLIIANAEACANHSNLDGVRFGMREEGSNLEEIMINSRTKGFSSAVRKRFVLGSYSLFVENQDRLFRKAQKVRRVVVNAYADLLKDFDVIMAPAAGSIAPHADETCEEQLSESYLVAENHMILGNLSGYPSLTLPTGFVDGLPIGVNVSAKAFEEQSVLNIAKAIEEECGLEGNCVEVAA